MNVLDYVIIALAVVGIVVGLFRGFIKLTLTVVGVIVVAALTATVEPYVQNWFVNTSMSDGTRNVVAMIATVLLIAAVYGFVAFLIGRLLRKVKIIKVLDRILGGVIGFAVVYLAFGLVFALIINTSDGFLPHIKNAIGDSFQNSWIGTHVYKNNFFGDWIINGIAQKLIDGLQPNKDPAALATLVALFA